MMSKTVSFLLVTPVISAFLLASPQTTQPSDQRNLSDPKDLEAFFDGVLNSQLKAYNIPGITISVVKAGKLLLSKGYGFANLDNRTPVVSDRTLFRVGSVSKLFVWTAVMQLVEEGKLDLDKDVNVYLKAFKIPATFPEPITLKHLMSHSPGFEDKLPIFAHSADDLEPVGKILERGMPERVRAPGTYSAYTNHGTTLAAYIVEQVSGKPFEEYVEENILKPLQMNHSTFRQPLPPALEPDMSIGYGYKQGTLVSKPFEFVRIAPAGSMSATASDMANFMIAHLQNGRFGAVHILREETAKLMHRHLFSPDARVNGWAYGFMEFTLNHLRVIGHGGDTFLFHSLLAMIPEQDLGLFVSYNSMGEGSGAVNARRILLKAFLDRYFPIPAQPMPRLSDGFFSRASLYAGSYKSTRRPFSTAHKMMGLVQQVRVTVLADSTLLTDGIMGQTTRWIEVEPLRFRPADGQPAPMGDLIFKQNEKGEVDHFFNVDNSTEAYEKAAWYETTSFNLLLVVVCLILFLTSVIGWPIGYFVRRRKPTESLAGSTTTRLAHWLAGITSVLFLLFFVLLGASLQDPLEFAFAVPGAFREALSVGLAAALLTTSGVFMSVIVWMRRYWSFARRLHFTLVVLAAISFVWWMNYWNLLGFKL